MNYKEMVNEVLIRMREDEITSVSDTDNDPQQKIVCKFVNDAMSLVSRSHTWNAYRKVWIIDLAHGKDRYVLADGVENSAVYAVTTGKKRVLHEANPRRSANDKSTMGSPAYYHTGSVNNHELVVTVSPVPDNTHGGTGNTSEYAIARFGMASYNNADKTLLVTGFAQPKTLKEDSDLIDIPTDPVIQYALAYAHSERGEAGGQSVMELFSIAKSSLSDAISWDVNNSTGEYLWSAV